MKWTALILSGLIIAVMLTGYTLPQYSLQKNLSGKLLRFHVIANSDDPKDQQLKLKVKDEVTGYLSGYLANAKSKEEAQEIIAGKKDEIKSIAHRIIKSEGYDYPVKVAMGRYEFPIKSYGNIALPEGDYDALRVVIGDGKGKNWWRVMFPPLCFIDVTHGQADDDVKEELSRVLTDKEIEDISTDKASGTERIQVKDNAQDKAQQMPQDKVQSKAKTDNTQRQPEEKVQSNAPSRPQQEIQVKLKGVEIIEDIAGRLTDSLRLAFQKITPE